MNPAVVSTEDIVGKLNNWGFHINGVFGNVLYRRKNKDSFAHKVVSVTEYLEDTIDLASNCINKTKND